MLFSLPSVTEKVFRDYLVAGYTETTVFRAFSIGEFVMPCVIVKAGQFRPHELGTHVYNGTVILSIHTQIDDTENALETHDSRVSAIYTLLAEKTAALVAMNASGEHFHAFNYEIEEYDQEVLEEQRGIISLITLSIVCQNMPA
jgi:hypothetical protein